MLISPQVFTRRLALACKARRQSIGLRQSDLAARSHVSAPTIVRFELTGKISVDALSRIVTALGMAEPLLAAVEITEKPKTVAEFVQPPKSRQRVRIPTRAPGKTPPPHGV